MKKLVLTDLLIMSGTERSAKKVSFDPRRTLIYGTNGTGKSCLIKTIYKTFGANPAKENPSWTALNPTSLVRFTVGGDRYSILKEGKFYAVFDSTDRIINVFESVTKELAPYLAQLFDFQIVLPDQQGNMITPPPAFLFLPYYVDQDVSWKDNWASFSGLFQIKSYREPIVSYHTGLRTNEYYKTKSEIEQYNVKISDLDQETRILRNLLVQVNEKLGEAEFTIDLDAFKEEIKQLLIECEMLRDKQEKLKANLVDLYNHKINLDSQLTIAKAALQESRKDYQFATDILVDDHVDCPTCGAHYQNSFLERFEIAKDEDRCRELVAELTKDIRDTDDQIAKENSLLTKNSEEIIRIEAILDKRKGQVKLSDVIESAGRQKVKSVFEQSRKDLYEQIGSNTTRKNELDRKLKGLTNKDRRQGILSLYYKYMKEFLRELDVTLKEETYKDIGAKIRETGSALPRALTAYYFSLFYVMQEYTTSVFCPLIIDSPNQQAQDLKHIEDILTFIDKQQPPDSQLILGLEELYNVDYKCLVIELTDKRKLLQDSEYPEVRYELDHFLTQFYNHGKGGRLLF